MASINEQILKEVSGLKKIITGNGNPKEGVIVKLTLVEQSLVSLIKDFKVHIDSAGTNKKYLGFLTPKHVDMLWKNFSRLMNIGIIATVVWVANKLDPDTLQVVIKALFK